MNNCQALLAQPASPYLTGPSWVLFSSDSLSWALRALAGPCSSLSSVQIRSRNPIRKCIQISMPGSDRPQPGLTGPSRSSQGPAGPFSDFHGGKPIRSQNLNPKLPGLTGPSRALQAPAGSYSVRIPFPGPYRPQPGLIRFRSPCGYSFGLARKEIATISPHTPNFNRP